MATWGAKAYGGDSSTVQAALIGVDRIYSTYCGCLMRNLIDYVVYGSIILGQRAVAEICVLCRDHQLLLEGGDVRFLSVPKFSLFSKPTTQRGDLTTLSSLSTCTRADLPVPS